MPSFVLGLRSSQLAAMWKKQPAGRENHCPWLQQPCTSQFISHTLLRRRRGLPVGQGPGRMALALGGPTHASITRRRMKAQCSRPATAYLRLVALSGRTKKRVGLRLLNLKGVRPGRSRRGPMEKTRDVYTTRS